MTASVSHPQRPDPIEQLTGRLSGRPRPRAISEPGQGGKFAPDGQVNHWPGNTIVCHIDPNSTAHQLLTELQAKIKECQFAPLFTFTPPSSFHMTVFQGWAPFLEESNIWPEDLPEKMSRDEATEVLKSRTESAILPRNYRVRPHDLFGLHSVTMRGADDWQEKSLRNARSVLREATGLLQPDFERYVFHITLGYQITWVDDDTARAIVDLNDALSAEYIDHIGDIQLGPCELCEFDSMHHFNPVKYINGHHDS